MDPAAAAEVLRKKIADPKRPMTAADASVESGLPLRDVTAGLHVLTSEYRGHLRVTEDGDLVHVFPHGFEKPWETREAFARVFDKVKGGLLAAGRFIVRAWLLIALVAYALAFVAILVGLTFARGSNDNRSQGGGGAALAGGLFRAVGDALFWTFHPWSPLYVGDSYGYGYASSPRERRGARRGGADDVPFYEKVNRFVFGPPVPARDPLAERARVLHEIREKKGRIGLADVMRITGLPREEADPLMARLMLDHEGEVEVGEQGGIFYRFEALRRTAEEDNEDMRRAPRPTGARAAWERPAVLPPLTGNDAGANLGIAALNGFNLLASAFVLDHGLTVSNLILLFTAHPRRGDPPIVLPHDGVPIAFGLVPLVFSIALFALPAIRAMFRAREAKKVARENARLAILREVLARAPKKEPVPDEVLRKAYRVATGEEASSKEITRRVVDLGGDVDVGPEGEVRYRFVDLEAEAEAVEDERAHAKDAEARLGRVVFSSQN